MKNGTLTRRLALRTMVGFGAVAAMGALAACTSPAPSPTTAPSTGSTSTSAPKPSGTTTAAQPTQAPAKQRSLTTVKLGQTAGVLENAFTMIGKETGAYAEFGIDPEWIDFQDGSTQIKALISGEMFASQGGGQAMLVATAEGANIRIIGATRPKLNFVLYARKDITKPEDLIGKNVGTAATGALLHQLMMAYLKIHNVPADQVNFVNIGSSPNVFRAVLGGKVDAGPSTIDFIPTAEADGNIHYIADFGQLLPNYLRVMVGALETTIQRDRELLENVLAGYAKSIRYAIDHPDETVKYAMEVLGKSEEEAKFGVDFEIKQRIIAPDLDFTEEQIRYVQELNVEAGEQREVLPFDRVATLELQKSVLAKIGPYQWK